MKMVSKPISLNSTPTPANKTVIPIFPSCYCDGLWLLHYSKCLQMNPPLYVRL